jgi:hypothetical protein
MRLDGLGLLGASDFRMQRNFTRDALKCCYLSCWFDLGDPSNAPDQKRVVISVSTAQSLSPRLLHLDVRSLIAIKSN